MNVSGIMTELKKLGSEQTRRTLMRHGAPENIFGVKVGDLKPIAKKLKGQQETALELYATGNSDAMYLAGLVADGSKMTKKQLETWAKNADWHMISEYTVPWVACESPFARELALKWIKSKNETVASSGWNTYSGIVAMNDDKDLDLAEIRSLLKQVESGVNSAPNRVRYTMNGFVISVGTYVKDLLKDAKATAKKIGALSIDMGDTSCKVPLATDYIAKIEKMGRVGKKRKTMKC